MRDLLAAFPSPLRLAGALALACGLCLAGCSKGPGDEGKDKPAPSAGGEQKKSGPEGQGGTAMPKDSKGEAPREGDKGDRNSPFEGYRPKTTPDTVADYRPGIGRLLEKLPAESLGNLPDLVARLEEQKRLAKGRPGEWTQGNVALGADEKEYRPSDEELVEGEIGDRIGRIVEKADAAALAGVLEKGGVADAEIAYRRFHYRHVDAMGSGRFFYASAPEEVRVALKK
jgi:hypothetical protein